MAEKGGTTALNAYKAGVKSAQGKKKRRNVYYFPVIRTAATLAGVSKMVNLRYIAGAIGWLMKGDLEKAGLDCVTAFTKDTDISGGVKLIATGVVLGKTLDYTKTNPRFKMGVYGIKLV